KPNPRSHPRTISNQLVTSELTLAVKHSHVTRIIGRLLGVEHPVGHVLQSTSFQAKSTWTHPTKIQFKGLGPQTEPSTYMVDMGANLVELLAIIVA
ncbi:hypothetical protein AMTR_s01505p00005160, partial [Amborella trichopoda]